MREWIADMTKGDPAATEFCCVLWEWFHLLDDLVDKDRDITAETIVRANMNLLYSVTNNPFWAAYKDTLLPLIHTSAVVYLESERYREDPDIQKRLAAQIMKSQYQDIFFHVAMLCGGVEHQLEMSRKYRGYGIDVEDVWTK